MNTPLQGWKPGWICGKHHSAHDSDCGYAGFEPDMSSRQVPTHAMQMSDEMAEFDLVAGKPAMKYEPAIPQHPTSQITSNTEHQTTGNPGTPENNRESRQEHQGDELRRLPEGHFEDEQTPCTVEGCLLVHRPPLTHELHMILAAEFGEASKCDDCIYGLYMPHKGVAQAIHHQTQIAQVRYALEKLQMLANYGNKMCEDGTSALVAIDQLCSLIDSVTLAQQTRLDELSKGEK